MFRIDKFSLLLFARFEKNGMYYVFTQVVRVGRWADRCGWSLVKFEHNVANHFTLAVIAFQPCMCNFT